MKQLGYVKYMLQNYGLNEANGATSPPTLTADLMPRFEMEAALNVRDASSTDS